MTTPKKISELPPLATLQSADIFPVVDGGVTKKVTAQAIRNFIGSNTGYTGSKGNAGFTGSAGAPGAPGSAGTQGGIGVTGYTGSAGTNGFTGSAGTNGTNGYTGSAGTNGFTGSAGTNGTNGFTGSAGTNGFTGSAGTNGTNGFTGSAGTNGYTGSAGTNGYTGSAGTNGYTGSKGDKGDPGTGGAANGVFTGDWQEIPVVYNQYDIVNDRGALYYWLGGIAGNSGSYPADDAIRWAALPSSGGSGNGYTGSAGADGYTGSEGGLGYTGSAGADGYTGSAGSDGYTGSQGAEGYTGSEGGLGYTGSAGANGTSVQIVDSVNDGQALAAYNTSGLTPGQGIIQEDTGHLQVWNGSSFSDVGQIKGDQGNPGYTGSEGGLGYTGSRAQEDRIVNGQYSVVVDATGVVTMVTDRGSIEFGALPEPGGPSHFHIMKAAGGTQDLFFGDDYNYVLQRGPTYQGSPAYGVEIGANDFIGSQQVWRFGTDGKLTFPSGNLSIGNYENSDLILGSENATFGVLAQGQSGSTGIQWIDNLSSPAQVAAVSVNDTNSRGAVQISTGLLAGMNPAPAYTWTFGDDGNLIVPGHILAQQGNDLTLSVYNPTVEGQPGGVALSLKNYDVETESRTTQFTLGAEDIELITDFSGTQRKWIFRKDGVLQLPDDADIVASDGVTSVLGGSGNGYTGSAGTNGYTGSAGENGYTGSEGSIGYTGSSSSVTVANTEPSGAFEGLLWYDTTDGRTYVYYDSFWVDASPAGGIGYTGSEGVGFTGSAGTNGYTGSASTEVGYTGSAGAGYTGSAGYAGSVGYTGSAGTNGYTGSAGTDGYAGSAGINGYTGSAGTNGYTGSAGINGYTGSAGTNGYTGSAGENGYTGSAGENGYTGSAGSDGYTGSAGSDGYTGSIGYTGSQSVAIVSATNPSDPMEGQIWYDTTVGKTYVYYDSFWVDANPAGATGYTGSTGDVGFTGSSGDVGFTGSAGDNGSAGDPGYTGSAGGIGDTGYQGSQGDVGFTGSQGDVGFQGSAGEPGAYGGDGQYGGDGAPGFTGSQGDTGYQGSQGDTGYQGSQGDTGYQGSAGEPGAYGGDGQYGGDGATGYQGSAGDTGYQGSQGDVGYQGSAGDIGATGYTGSKGYTGSIGYTGSSAVVAYGSTIRTASGPTITVDFSSDGAILYTNSGTSLSVTVGFANYVAGKRVLVIIQNTSDSSTTIVTLGVPKEQSVAGDTVVLDNGKLAQFLEYMSFGTDINSVFLSTNKP